MVTLAEACRRLGEPNANWLRGYCDGLAIPLSRVGQSVQMTEASFRRLKAAYLKLGRGLATAAA